MPLLANLCYSPRVIHAMRTWLSHSFDDFKDERLNKKLQEFLKIVQKWVNWLKFQFHATHIYNVSQANS